MNRKQALCLFLVLSFAFGDTVSLNSIVKNHQLGINPCPPRRLMGMGKRIAIVIICRIEIGKLNEKPEKLLSHVLEYEIEI